PRRLRRGRLRFRAGVAFLHLAQPAVRAWGRWRHGSPARREMPPLGPLPGPITRVSRSVLVMPADCPRAELAAHVVACLRRAGMRVLPAIGWEDHDGRVVGSLLLAGDLVTSATPEGWVQLRMRVRLRPMRALVAAVAVGLA